MDTTAIRKYLFLIHTSKILKQEMDHLPSIAKASTMKPSLKSSAVSYRHWCLWNEKFEGGSEHEHFLSNGEEKEDLVTIPLNENDRLANCGFQSHHRDSMSASTLASSTMLLSETSSSYDSYTSGDDESMVSDDDDDTAGVFTFSISLSSAFMNPVNLKNNSLSGISQQRQKHEEAWDQEMGKEEFAMIASSILTDAIIQ